MVDYIILLSVKLNQKLGIDVFVHYITFVNVNTHYAGMSTFKIKRILIRKAPTLIHLSDMKTLIMNT